MRMVNRCWQNFISALISEIQAMARRHTKWLKNQIAREGASYIELTPTNHINERFWERAGFIRTNDLDEDGKNFYRKFF